MEASQAIVTIRASHRCCLFLVYDQAADRVMKTFRVPVLVGKPLLVRAYQLYTTLEWILGRYNPYRVVIEDFPKVVRKSTKSTGYSIAFVVGALATLVRAWDVEVIFQRLYLARRIRRTMTRAMVLDSVQSNEEREALTLCLSTLVTPRPLGAASA